MCSLLDERQPQPGGVSLLHAFAAGNEAHIQKVKSYCQGLSRLPTEDTDVRLWSNAHELAWIPIAPSQIRQIRSDGHCLFAAILCSWRYHDSGGKLQADISEIEPKARRYWVKIARKILSGEIAVGDASVSEAAAILLDGTQTAEQYLEFMSQSPPSRQAWGGESELHMLALVWKCQHVQL